MFMFFSYYLLQLIFFFYWNGSIIQNIISMEELCFSRSLVTSESLIRKNKFLYNIDNNKYKETLEKNIMYKIAWSKVIVLCISIIVLCLVNWNKLHGLIKGRATMCDQCKNDGTLDNNCRVLNRQIVTITIEKSANSIEQDQHIKDFIWVIEETK